MNAGTMSFNNIMGQLTEMSQWKEKPRPWLYEFIDNPSLWQACPTFLVLRATFTRGNLLRATNAFCGITISYCDVTNTLILVSFMR